jgi:leader peptidase (prepilin peptidase)/N-methyltransferase
VGGDEFTPESVPHLEAVSSEIVLPREAMGVGDVKFMGAIGAFLGWKAVLFCLTVGSMIGAVVGVALIALRRQSSTRLPFIPFLALAAALWIFAGHRLVALGLAAADWIFGGHRLAALGWPMR